MKITRPADLPPPGAYGGGKPHSAREAAMEKELARYIPLACGHFTSRAQHDFYADMTMPRRGMEWCEECDEWVRHRPKPVTEPLPEEPLF